MALCYLLPLLGGWIADRYLGKYRTIVYFSIPYILGHIILGAFSVEYFLYIALLLLALGSGAIKPNTSTLMGLMYEEQCKPELLTEAFSYFYLSINIGAMISSFALPVIRNAYGYRVALMIPTVLMVMALGIFILGRRHYPREIRQRLSPEDSEGTATARRQVLRSLAAVFGLIALFWFVYDQNSTTWVYFTRQDMTMQLWPLDITLTPDQIQGINPLLIVFLTPLFNATWNALTTHRGVEIPAAQKMLYGFWLIAICTGVMSLAGFVSASGKVSVWLIVIATIIMTLAELCVSVVGLQYAFTKASAEMKSTVMAAFLFTAFFGDGIAAGYDQLWGVLSHGQYFGIQATVMIMASLAFGLITRKERRQSIVMSHD